jgi:transposase
MFAGLGIGGKRTAVCVIDGSGNSVDTHRLKALLGARDQLVKLKRSLGNQVRGLLRPFGIKLPSRAGGKNFDEAAYLATRNDPMLHAAVRALRGLPRHLESAAKAAVQEREKAKPDSRRTDAYARLRVDADAEPRT